MLLVRIVEQGDVVLLVVLPVVKYHTPEAERQAGSFCGFKNLQLATFCGRRQVVRHQPSKLIFVGPNPIARSCPPLLVGFFISVMNTYKRRLL